MVADERTRWTDDRLDDFKEDIDRRLRMVDALPQLMAGLSAQVSALQTKVVDNHASTEKRIERNHVASEKRLDALDNDIGGVSKALWSLLAGLLIVVVGAVVAIVLVL
jgi:hypothetical protein